jgi:hypothetical protein
MLIRKSTHDRLLAKAVADAVTDERATADAIAEVRESTIARLRKVIGTLEVQTADMQPDAELGKKRRLQYDKDNAKRKAERAAK